MILIGSVDGPSTAKHPSSSATIAQTCGILLTLYFPFFASGVQNGACTGTNSPYVTDRYYQVSAFTGGLVGDICPSDWSGMLAELGLTASGIRTGFQTTYLAKVDTLVVTVDGEEIPVDPTNGYVYDTDTWYITFGSNAVPARDAEVVADYTIQSGGEAPDAAVATGI